MSIYWEVNLVALIHKFYSTVYLVFYLKIRKNLLAINTVQKWFKKVVEVFKKEAG